jgi:hypothetical protein
MTYEESSIINFLEGSPNEYIGRKEIARKAMGRNAFEEDPRWADAALISLVNQGLVEQNDSGHYKIKKYEG